MSAEVEVYALLRMRAPGKRWSARRVALVVADFPGLDHRVVAARAADFIEHDATRIGSDAHSALRGFFERAWAEGTSPPGEDTDWTIYDRLEGRDG